MARTTRQVSKTGVYHVLLRGDALFQKDEDKQYFEGLLSEYFQTDAILGYLLQENRIHIVIHSDDLSKEIKPLCTAYARYYNRCYSVEGKLFCDRFKSEPLEDEESVSRTLAYINRFGAKKKKKKAPKAKKSAAPKAEKKAVKTSKPEKAEETPAAEEIPQKEEKPETPKKKKKELSVWLL